MMNNITYEGIWEEIAAAHGDDLAGHRVRIVVLEPEEKSLNSVGSLSPVEIEKRQKAWESFTSKPLSKVELHDSVLSRESMYDNEQI